MTAMGRIVFVAGLAWAALALAEAISLTGTVKGQDGQPKPFVSVQLEGPGRYVAVTDANGQFTITPVAPGHYTVRVRQGDRVETFSRKVDSAPIELIVKW